MQTEQLFCWSDMTDTEHTTSIVQTKKKKKKRKYVFGQTYFRASVVETIFEQGKLDFLT